MEIGHAFELVMASSSPQPYDRTRRGLGHTRDHEESIRHAKSRKCQNEALPP